MGSSKKFILNSMDNMNHKGNERKEKQSVANSKLISSCGIVYNVDVNEDTYIETMKQGYLAMQELNLELSEYGFESYINDLIEYEASL